jgi:hypothetical protein
MGLPQLEDLREEVRLGFQRLGITDDGWNAFLESLRRWVFYREPQPDGLVHCGDVLVAARLWNPFGKRLPQDFPGNERVYVLNTALVDCFRNHIRGAPHACLILQGKPGAGKSSFLSGLAGKYASHLATGGLDEVEAVILYHCFLSADDPTYAQRTQYEAVAADLKRQLYWHYSTALTNAGDDEVQLLRQDPENLVAWLCTCAQDAASRSRKILLVLDGLDHVVSQRDRDEVVKILRLIPNPLPDGLFLAIGTQPIPDLLPYPLRDNVTETITTAGFDRRGIAGFAQCYLGSAPDQQLLNALETKSEGNPLYLRYILEEASRSGGLTTWGLERVPPYGGAIGVYYGRLWSALTNEARTLLGALATATFNMPADELSFVMAQIGESATATATALASVQHLLDTRGRTVRIYHPSFKTFVEQQDHVVNVRPSIISALRQWISERGSELLRWACEWEYTYLAGDPEPLLRGTTRQWAVESYALLRPPTGVERLLRLAMGAARAARDLPRLVARGRLLAYIASMNEYQMDSAAMSAIRSARVYMWSLADVVNLAFDEA